MEYWIALAVAALIFAVAVTGAVREEVRRFRLRRAARRRPPKSDSHERADCKRNGQPSPWYPPGDTADFGGPDSQH